MAQFRDALPRESQVRFGGLLRLLDERVDHDHPPSDEKAVERAPDARPPARAKLEQSSSHRARERQPPVRAVLGQQLPFLGTSLIRNHLQCRICWTGHAANALLALLLWLRV
jgi:hypothetical protein